MDHAKVLAVYRKEFIRLDEAMLMARRKHARSTARGDGKSSFLHEELLIVTESRDIAKTRYELSVSASKKEALKEG